MHSTSLGLCVFCLVWPCPEGQAQVPALVLAPLAARASVSATFWRT